MTNDQISTRVPQQPITLAPMQEYTVEDLTVLTQKNELGKYVTISPMLKKQIQKMTQRFDLTDEDFVAFALRNTYQIDVQAENIKPAWNKRTVVCKRLNIEFIPCPEERQMSIAVESLKAKSEIAEMTQMQPIKAVADITKPMVFDLPLKSTIEKVGAVGTIKSKSVESEIEDLKSRLEQIIKNAK